MLLLMRRRRARLLRHCLLVLLMLMEMLVRALTLALIQIHGHSSHGGGTRWTGSKGELQSRWLIWTRIRVKAGDVRRRRDE